MRVGTAALECPAAAGRRSLLEIVDRRSRSKAGQQPTASDRLCGTARQVMERQVMERPGFLRSPPCRAASVGDSPPASSGTREASGEWPIEVSAGHAGPDVGREDQLIPAAVEIDVPSRLSAQASKGHPSTMCGSRWPGLSPAMSASVRTLCLRGASPRPGWSQPRNRK